MYQTTKESFGHAINMIQNHIHINSKTLPFTNGEERKKKVEKLSRLRSLIKDLNQELKRIK